MARTLTRQKNTNKKRTNGSNPFACLLRWCACAWLFGPPLALLVSPPLCAVVWWVGFGFCLSVRLSVCVCASACRVSSCVCVTAAVWSGAALVVFIVVGRHSSAELASSATLHAQDPKLSAG